ncbi:MAG: hypothetical protein WBA12_14460, partial [Catalinimonas sp.]
LLLCSLVLAPVTISPPALAAKNPLIIIDKKTIKEKAKGNVKNLIKLLWKQYKLEQDRRTRRRYAGINSLQDFVDRYQRLGGRVRRTKLAAVQDVRALVTSLSGDWDQLLGNGNFPADLDLALHGWGSKPGRARRIHRLLHVMDLGGPASGGPAPTDPAALRQRRRQVGKARWAFVAAADQRKLQVAGAFKELSTQLKERAEEVNQMVTDDGRYAMTAAERIDLMKLAEQYLAQSHEVSVRSDALMKEVGNDPRNPAHRAGVVRHRRQMLRLMIQ